MRHFAAKRILILATSMLACTACVSTGNSLFGTGADSSAMSADATTSAGSFGDEFAVQATIGRIKSNGNQNRLSSRAIRLPERPLGEIAVFDYQFPPSCGSHEFRVLEASETQILEYQFAAQNGSTYAIRDYVSGSSPFVKAGLWSANDHTADSISTMTSQVAQSGDRMFSGVYSQGLVTGLPVSEQRALGAAYQQAVSDVYNCRDTRTMVGATGE